ncbi:MAG: CidA/LrgA family protein [Chloroflexaceae bacterium]|nr:CidA/LrgA family protein [Chloroflexaceae bacterium]
MILALTTLLLFQLAGEIVVFLTGIPIPGPVIGMLLLLLALLYRGQLSPSLQSTAQGLLAHLALLFVPVGTGVMLHLKLLQTEWLPILVVLIGGTLITLMVTALTMSLVVYVLPDSTPTEGQSS